MISLPVKNRTKSTNQSQHKVGATLSGIKKRHPTHNLVGGTLSEIKQRHATPNLEPEPTLNDATSDDSRRHCCSKCGKRYLQAVTLRRHVQYECGVLPRFQCTLCNYRAKRNNELTLHYYRRHGYNRDRE
uniref:Longitudinals lacking protein, isoforms A/B/D/L n=1 Tax=Cacopsylla melanoneura TaxID=428564 RepID=A0A8D9EWP2_9HEMI